MEYQDTCTPGKLAASCFLKLASAVLVLGTVAVVAAAARALRSDEPLPDESLPMAETAPSGSVANTSCKTECALFNSDTEKSNAEVKRAINFMTAYYDAWNATARLSQEIRPAELSADQLGNVLHLYKEGASVTLIDTGIAGSKPLTMPASSFAPFFLSKQRGSIHQPVYLCAAGNKLTVGLWYFVPFVGEFLTPRDPEHGKVAVRIYITATYEVDFTHEQPAVTSLSLSYDFNWFNDQSNRNGVPVQL